jgi:hypothetical protein
VSGVFSNPAGVVFRVLTFTRIRDDADVEGPASTDATWFAGYAWSALHCSSCGCHLGWRYDWVGTPPPRSSSSSSPRGSAKSSARQRQQQQQQQQQQHQQKGLMDYLDTHTHYTYFLRRSSAATMVVFGPEASRRARELMAEQVAGAEEAAGRAPEQQQVQERREAEAIATVSGENAVASSTEVDVVVEDTGSEENEGEDEPADDNEDDEEDDDGTGERDGNGDLRSGHAGYDFHSRSMYVRLDDLVSAPPHGMPRFFFGLRQEALKVMASANPAGNHLRGLVGGRGGVRGGNGGHVRRIDV